MNIVELSGVGEKRAHALQCAGIFTVEDLLEWFPRDYDDRSKVKLIAELVPDAVNTLRGVVAFEPEAARLKRFTLVKVKIRDETGVLECIWFNQPFLKKNFKKGSQYIFTGKVKENGAVLQMISPEYEAVAVESGMAGSAVSASTTSGMKSSASMEAGALSGGRIVPVYTTPKMYSQKTFRALIFKALEKVLENAENLRANKNVANCDVLSADIRKRYNLVDRMTAIKNIHFPESDDAFLQARRRLVFEELFLFQTALINLKKDAKTQAGAVLADTDYAPFLEKLPFAPTGAQMRVMQDIAKDFSSGWCANRLIQGDVGSGKTAVAFAAAFLAAKNGLQTALMAPTDVLATQHFAESTRLFAPLGFETVLLVGGLPAKARRDALAKIADGTAAIIIGTHALIQDSVVYHRLGLCITDEQHRFGVNQRLALSLKSEKNVGFFEDLLLKSEKNVSPFGDLSLKSEKTMGSFGEGGSPLKNCPPHVLVMSATPIPRTLGMVLYADLDI